MISLGTESKSLAASTALKVVADDIVPGGSGCDLLERSAAGMAAWSRRFVQYSGCDVIACNGNGAPKVIRRDNSILRRQRFASLARHLDAL